VQWHSVRLAALFALALVVGFGSFGRAETGAAVGCAWLGESDQRDVNIGAPDLDAYYVEHVLRPDSSTDATIHGRFPHARYFSFHVYDAQGDVVGSIYDQQITADRGSVNPYRRRASWSAGDDYTVRVAFSAAPAKPAPNTLYVDPAKAGAAAPLVYRVYVPRHASDPSGDVGYPEVVTSRAGQTALDQTALDQGGCATSPPPFGSLLWKEEAALDYPSGLPAATNASATKVPTWTRAYGSKLGNEQNSYLGAILSRQYGDLVVVHTRAPSFPDTLRGVPAYANTQLRYWSFCTYDDQGEAGFGCVADYAAGARRGRLTYVVSDRGQRPSNATTANGVAWVPWGATQSAIQLVYRNMLPAKSFRYAAQRIQPGQSAKTVMGPYYPQAVYCSKATFERGGWKACFRSAG
jgi:hypothetical protein